MAPKHRTRRDLLKYSTAGAASLALSGCVWFSRRPRSRRPFTLIALPDTQIYSLSYPDIFLQQTQWIKEHKDDLNVVCVVHEGDITDRNSTREWVLADKAICTLDGAAIPYCMAQGNHDMPEGGKVRDNTQFNRFFPPVRFEKRPWYGGHYDRGNENAYYDFKAGGMKFLVICLEFGPRDQVLDWANTVAAEHEKHRLIVATHCYLDHDDTRVGPGDGLNPHDYGCGGNDGEDIWNKFVRKHPNIFLVLSGHIVGDGTGRLISAGDHGNKVLQVSANYQMQENGGNGWLRILTFVPDQNKIRFRTYSPFLKRDATDEQNEFELDYVMD